MKRSLLVIALATVFVAAPAQAKLVALTASPNPAGLGVHVRHTLSMGGPSRIELFISAVGFERPGTGTLPPGSWAYRCCPAQTAGTPAWYYRSTVVAPAGTYGFRALARSRGTFLSTASTSIGSASVWVRVT